MIRGDFEYHVTVSDDAAAAAALAVWARARDVKFTHIVLARGEMPSQPMLTVRVAGTIVSVLEEASLLAGGLRGSGFDVVRVKLEASPFAEGVPSTAEDGCYFEHHIKLLLPPDADESALVDVVTPHGAHLSRNVRRIREDGNSERFVTQRCHAAAVDRLGALTEDLRAALYNILSVEREYVVYDDRPSVDAGWIH
jgi:hypothetical protein